MARQTPLPNSERNLTVRELNRCKDVSKKDSTVKDISIGLMDVDAAIMYYFTEVITPTVVENGETIKVPIMYANPERWKSVQKMVFYGMLKSK